MSDRITFWRQVVDAPYNSRRYVVHRGGRRIGEVERSRGFSYRGTEGWNRGIRCRDFHPVQWQWRIGSEVWRGRYDTRIQATTALLREVEAVTLAVGASEAAR